MTERDRQLAAIGEKLGTYQRRYPGLDLAWEYRIWVLDVKARGIELVDFEMGFLRHLEQRSHYAAGGRTSFEAAFSAAPHLLPAFERLVAAQPRRVNITPDTAAIYASEFASCSAEEWEAICDHAIRTCDGMPSIAALSRISDEIRAVARERAELTRIRAEQSDRRSLDAQAAAADAEIEALRPEQLAALNAQAEELVQALRLDPVRNRVLWRALRRGGYQSAKEKPCPLPS